jgi:hypothetical protein
MSQSPKKKSRPNSKKKGLRSYNSTDKLFSSKSTASKGLGFGTTASLDNATLQKYKKEA